MRRIYLINAKYQQIRYVRNIKTSIAEDLTYYFATSEQVPSSVGLGVLMNKDVLPMKNILIGLKTD